ncbi:MAG: glycosyltransferase [Smithella sp.]
MIQRKILQYSAVWPIDEKAATPPENWQGWPEGKKFAFVITHDVETTKGLNNCGALMDIEEKYGFRSSFNFVAGDYPIPQDLLDEMHRRGFEAGSHGLHHNGNLFRSRNVFNEHATRINQFLKKHSIVGFRSPSMYHNLDWLHELNIEYDASTFDTDPFEPQPDGMGTIFPFWVSSNTSHKGYVELPYTLPQDFLLFILMQEKSIDIWKTKIDWIVRHGGMALLISHPDYMNFNNKDLLYDEYPCKYYEEFLRLIKSKYEGQYWNALPRDVSRFWIKNMCKNNFEDPLNFDQNASGAEPCSLRQNTHHLPLTLRTSPIHACMLVYAFYESDNRVMRYAEALVKRGDSVDVIALRKEGAPRYEKIRGVNVYRIQKRMIDEKGRMSYLLKLLTFLLNSLTFLTVRHLKYPYDLVHVHSVPDFEVFAAIITKLRGAKIILDIHDIVPEFYASKFNKTDKSILFRALSMMERLSIKFSDHVIISNHIWEKTLLSRSAERQKCTVIMNYPDKSIFYKRPRERKDNKYIMIYPGTLGWHQGLDIAINAFAKIKDQMPDAEFHIYGRGPQKKNLEHLIEKLSLSNKVFIRDTIPIAQIANIMANADLGIIPKRNDPFGGEAFSTKILEFMSLGVPIIVSETKIDKFYFNESILKFFTPENEDDLAQCMLLLRKDNALRDRLVRKAQIFVENYNWDKKKNEYFCLVDTLIEKRKYEQQQIL